MLGVHCANPRLDYNEHSRDAHPPSADDWAVRDDVGAEAIISCGRIRAALLLRRIRLDLEWRGLQRNVAQPAKGLLTKITKNKKLKLFSY